MEALRTENGYIVVRLNTEDVGLLVDSLSYLAVAGQKSEDDAELAALRFSHMETTRGFFAVALTILSNQNLVPPEKDKFSNLAF